MPGALVSNITSNGIISSTVAPWYNTGEIISTNGAMDQIYRTTASNTIVTTASNMTALTFYNVGTSTQISTVGNNVTYVTTSADGEINTVWFHRPFSGTGSIFYNSSIQVYDPEVLRRLENQKKLAARNRSAAIHRAKGSIKRALKLMDNVGFGDDVRVFLSGDEIEVSHPDSIFKFVISKGSHNLIDKTMSPSHSTPYNLTLYTKTNIYVAKLCVVVKDTPILDSVLALALFIKSGDEEHILRVANWYSLSKDIDDVLEVAIASPLAESKLKLERFDVSRW